MWEFRPGTLRIDACPRANVVVCELPPGFRYLSGIGVDPGIKFGIAVIHENKAWVINGTLDIQKEKWRYAIQAYDIAYILGLRYTHNVVVEGAAFRKEFGQVGLSSVRTAFALGFCHAGRQVEIVPPAKIRAQALGDGRMKAVEVWPTLNHNGADALAAALYAAGVRRDE